MKPRIWQDGVDILCGGDIILFGGGGGVLDTGIEVVTGSLITHTAMVFPPELLAPRTPIQITESTRPPLGSPTGAWPLLRNGPQLNPLDGRLLADPLVWVATIAPRYRAFLDWPAMWQLALAKMGQDKYSVAQLAFYLGRKIPILGLLPELYRSIPGEEVCGEYLAMLLHRGGFPGINPAVMSPRSIAELNIFSDLLQLHGPVTEIPRFSTV